MNNSNELSPKNDNVLGVNSKQIKSDILMFKNETLRDIKNFTKNLSEKYETTLDVIKQKLETYDIKMNLFNEKIALLSNTIISDKSLKEKINNLLTEKDKMLNDISSNEFRIRNLEKSHYDDVTKINKILNDTVIYPGIIGGMGSKIKTFHEFIDYVLHQCALNLTFREKNNMDLSQYKNKLETLIQSFKIQIDTINNNCNQFTTSKINESEEKMKNLMLIYDDRLQDTRVENANYAVGLVKTCDELREQIKMIDNLKNEFYTKMENEVDNMKDDNQKVYEKFTGYRAEFNFFKDKLSQISEWIRDVRFRINVGQEIKTKEFTNMANQVDFSKRYGKFKNIGATQYESAVKKYIKGEINANELNNISHKKDSNNVSQKIIKQDDNNKKLLDNDNNSFNYTRRKSVSNLGLHPRYKKIDNYVSNDKKLMSGEKDKTFYNSIKIERKNFFKEIKEESNKDNNDINEYFENSSGEININKKRYGSFIIHTPPEKRNQIIKNFSMDSEKDQKNIPKNIIKEEEEEFNNSKLEEENTKVIEDYKKKINNKNLERKGNKTSSLTTLENKENNENEIPIIQNKIQNEINNTNRTKSPPENSNNNENYIKNINNTSYAKNYLDSTINNNNEKNKTFSILPKNNNHKTTNKAVIISKNKNDNESKKNIINNENSNKNNNKNDNIMSYKQKDNKLYNSKSSINFSQKNNINNNPNNNSNNNKYNDKNNNINDIINNNMDNNLNNINNYTGSHSNKNIIMVENKQINTKKISPINNSMVNKIKNNLSPSNETKNLMKENKKLNSINVNFINNNRPKLMCYRDENNIPKIKISRNDDIYNRNNEAKDIERIVSNLQTYIPYYQKGLIYEENSAKNLYNKQGQYIKNKDSSLKKNEKYKDYFSMVQKMK